jgi:hypothetical protein
MEKVETFEKIGPHIYKTKFLDGSEVEIRLVWAKTNVILKKIMGFSVEIKTALLTLLDGDTRGAIQAAIASISDQMIYNFFDDVNEIVCRALDEYDEKGKLVKAGDTTLMNPEDVKAVIEVVIADIMDLLKNVLGPVKAATVIP